MNSKSLNIPTGFLVSKIAVNIRRNISLFSIENDESLSSFCTRVETWLNLKILRPPYLLLSSSHGFSPIRRKIPPHVQFITEIESEAKGARRKLLFLKWSYFRRFIQRSLAVIMPIPRNGPSPFLRSICWNTQEISEIKTSFRIFSRNFQLVIIFLDFYFQISKTYCLLICNDIHSFGILLKTVRNIMMD